MSNPIVLLCECGCGKAVGQDDTGQRTSSRGHGLVITAHWIVVTTNGKNPWPSAGPLVPVSDTTPGAVLPPNAVIK